MCEAPFENSARKFDSYPWVVLGTLLHIIALEGQSEITSSLDMHNMNLKSLGYAASYNKHNSNNSLESRCSSVSIATGYGLDGRDSIPCGGKICLFFITSRPALGPT
jgi:hypothetical protein